MNSYTKLLKEVAESCYDLQENDSEWNKKYFSILNLLKPDFSGKVGELFLVQVLRECGLDVSYEQDKIDSDAVYDLKIGTKNIEVKTARKGKHGAFQHENLRKNCDTDAYAFLDIYPQGEIILTILSKQEIAWHSRSELTGRKPHLRKGAEDQFKYDFGSRTHKKLLKKQVAIDLSRSTSDDLLSYLKKREII